VGRLRQAIKYERQLVDAKVKAHIDLTEAQQDAERKLTELAISYERKYTDGQFGQLNLVAQEHRAFHEREHLLYEQAIEKAASSLKQSLDAIQLDVDRFRDETPKWMTVDRFEREHNNLSEKTELAIETLAAKVVAEERVTLRSQAQEELRAGLASNRRWMIGLMVTITLFGITTIIGLATTALHVFKII
jgi:hypothetical protein